MFAVLCRKLHKVARPRHDNLKHSGRDRRDGMLKPEDNERLVRGDAGTPAGELMRRYWQPALLSAELPENDCPPARVRLLGEDLVPFRESNDRIGLIDAYCPHRRGR